MQTGYSGPGGTIIDPSKSPALHYTSSAQRYSFFVANSLADPTIDETGTVDQSNISSDGTYSTFNARCATSRITYRLILFNPGAANPLLPLRYASFGKYVFSTYTVASQSDYTRYFSYAHPSSASEANQSGTATYNGVFFGHGIERTFVNNLDYDLSGTVSISVDFDRKTFTANMVLSGNKTTSGDMTPVTFGPVSFTQDGATFPAQLSGTTPAGDKFLGFLAGPTAQEFGFTFRVTMANPYDYAHGPVTLIGSGAAKR